MPRRPWPPPLPATPGGCGRPCLASLEAAVEVDALSSPDRGRGSCRHRASGPTPLGTGVGEDLVQALCHGLQPDAGDPGNQHRVPRPTSAPSVRTPRAGSSMRRCTSRAVSTRCRIGVPAFRSMYRARAPPPPARWGHRSPPGTGRWHPAGRPVQGWCQVTNGVSLVASRCPRHRNRVVVGVEGAPVVERALPLLVLGRVWASGQVLEGGRVSATIGFRTRWTCCRSSSASIDMFPDGRAAVLTVTVPARALLGVNDTSFGVTPSGSSPSFTAMVLGRAW